MTHSDFSDKDNDLLFSNFCSSAINFKKIALFFALFLPFHRVACILVNRIYAQTFIDENIFKHKNKGSFFEVIHIFRRKYQTHLYDDDIYIIMHETCRN